MKALLRPLSDGEATFALMHRELCGTTQVATLFSIKGSLSKERIAHAVKNWIRRFQILRVEIVEQDETLWFSERGFPQALPLAFAAGRFEGREDAILEEDINDVIAPGSLPWRLTVMYDETADETGFVFSRNHAISDGVTTARLITALLAAFDEPGDETLSLRLGRSIDDLTYRSEHLTCSGSRTASDVVSQDARSLTVFDAPAALEGRNASVISIPISSRDACRIGAICKQHALTINQYFGAAMIEAYARTCGQPDAVEIFTAASLRGRFAEAPVLDDLGCYIAVISAKVPLASPNEEGRDFVGLARTYGELVASSNRAFRPIRRAHSEIRDKVREMGDRAGHSGICITNLGRLDYYLGQRANRIMRLRTAVNRRAGNYGLVLHLLSHAGRMTASLAFASPSISRERAEAVVQTLMS